MKRYLAEHGLVLLGEIGVGKTALLLALVRSLAERWVMTRRSKSKVRAIMR